MTAERSEVPARLPEYSVRRSNRARRVRLSVSARHGLVVVVPNGWRGDVAGVVASKREWAERSLAAVAERRAELSASAEALLPHEIELPAIGVRLRVEYRDGAGGRVSARASGGAVVVSGAIDDAEACLAALRRWLLRTARAELPPLCAEVGRGCGLSPTSVRVATPRTRWGSCSSAGRIMLNRNLLFLPRHLAEALVLHELAHLKVLDHSPRFWSLLATLDPNALEHRAQLRNAGAYVPAWADA